MPIDYSKMTDGEIDAALAAAKPPAPKKDYSEMSDEELDTQLSVAKSSRAPPAAAKLPEVSKASSALSGAAQGVSFGFGDELSGATGYLAGKLGIAPDVGYEYYRDFARNKDKEAAAANPKTYGGAQLAGGVATAAIPGLGAANSFKKAAGVGAIMGGGGGVGSSEADMMSLDMIKDAGLGATLGGVAGGGAQKLGNFLTGAKPVTQNLNKLADDLAEKATGATAVQAEKFADGAGNILRKQKLVRFGDSPANIAERVAAAEKQSGINIGNALSDLDSQGATMSRVNVIRELQGKADELSQFDGTSKTVKKLNKEIKELSNNLLDNTSSPISKGEIAKRNYQSMTNYFSPEADKSVTGFAAKAFKEEVERAATEANPELAKAFIDDKKLFSVLRPVKEAAERRATQLNQSPFGGIGDAMSAAAGAAGGPLGMAKAVIGRRLLAPRLSSSMSAATGATADTLAAVNRTLGAAAAPVSDAIQVGARTEAVNELMRRLQSKNGKKSAAEFLRSLNLSESKQSTSSPWSALMKEGK